MELATPKNQKPKSDYEEPESWPLATLQSEDALPGFRV